MNNFKLELDHPNKSLENIIYGLIYLYVFAIPFQSLKLRLLSFDIAPTEIVYLLLVPLAIMHIFLSDKKFWIDKLDFFILGWLATNILAGWHAGFDLIVLTAIIKKVYFVLLYMVLKWVITPVVVEKFVKVIILSSLVAALTGIIGFWLGYVGIETSLAIIRPFPYGFKHVIQAKGFALSPNMLASIIMIGIFFHLQNNPRFFFVNN